MVMKIGFRRGISKLSMNSESDESEWKFGFLKNAYIPLKNIGKNCNKILYT
jgi:hypothetical protein